MFQAKRWRHASGARCLHHWPLKGVGIDRDRASSTLQLPSWIVCGSTAPQTKKKKMNWGSWNGGPIELRRGGGRPAAYSPLERRCRRTASWRSGLGRRKFQRRNYLKFHFLSFQITPPKTPHLSQIEIYLAGSTVRQGGGQEGAQNSTASRRKRRVGASRRAQWRAGAAAAAFASLVWGSPGPSDQI